MWNCRMIQLFQALKDVVCVLKSSACLHLSEHKKSWPVIERIWMIVPTFQSVKRFVEGLNRCLNFSSRNCRPWLGVSLRRITSAPWDLSIMVGTIWVPTGCLLGLWCRGVWTASGKDGANLGPRCLGVSLWVRIRLVWMLPLVIIAVLPAIVAFSPRFEALCGMRPSFLHTCTFEHLALFGYLLKEGWHVWNSWWPEMKIHEVPQTLVQSMIVYQVLSGSTKTPNPWEHRWELSWCRKNRQTIHESWWEPWFCRRDRQNHRESMSDDEKHYGAEAMYRLTENPWILMRSMIMQKQ